MVDLHEEPELRLPIPKPPKGWKELAWELAVVVVGVLIALAAQQWADDRSWSGKVDHLRGAIREEVADHYLWSVAWRTNAPCMLAQIDALERQVLASGQRLHRSRSIRTRARAMSSGCQAANMSAASMTAVSPTDPSSGLGRPTGGPSTTIISQISEMQSYSLQNDETQHELFGLTRPIPLDPGVRYQLLHTLDLLRGRVELMDQVSGQLIDKLRKLRLSPGIAPVRQQVEGYPTWRFCRARHLPLRSVGQVVAATTG